MDFKKTALMLLGFQNDFFASNGCLRGSLEDDSLVESSRDSTVNLLEHVADRFGVVIFCPNVFKAGYAELGDPTGVLLAIKENGAFLEGKPGSAMIEQLRPHQGSMVVTSGKAGFSAFTDSQVENILMEKGIQEVTIAGAVTAICVDSTARAATEKGYRVSILEDCTCARSRFEQDYFLENVFPLYAHITHSSGFMNGNGN